MINVGKYTILGWILWDFSSFGVSFDFAKNIFIFPNFAWSLFGPCYLKKKRRFRCDFNLMRRSPGKGSKERGKPTRNRPFLSTFGKKLMQYQKDMSQGPRDTFFHMNYIYNGYLANVWTSHEKILLWRNMALGNDFEDGWSEIHWYLAVWDLLPIILEGPFRQLELECQIKHTVLLLIQRQKVTAGASCWVHPSYTLTYTPETYITWNLKISFFQVPAISFRGSSSSLATLCFWKWFDCEFLWMNNSFTGIPQIPM